MAKTKFILLPILVLSLASFATWGQRGGPPQRIANPQTIYLEGESRVEFREFASPALGEQGEYSIFLPSSVHAAEYATTLIPKVIAMNTE